MSSSNPLVQSYLDAIYVISQSKNTVEAYLNALKHLEKFTALNHECDLESLLTRIKAEQVDRYKFLREFVVYLSKSGQRSTTIKSCIAGVKGFFRHHEVKIYNEDFRQTVKMPKIIRSSKIPITKDIIVRLLRNSNSRLQTVILIAVASGMRIGEIVQLRTSDFDFNSNPVKIRVRAEIAKGKQARETFLSSEASLALLDYLKRTFGWDKNNNQDRLVFVKSNNTKPNVDSIRSSLIYSLKIACEDIEDLAKRNENGRRAIHFHAFREYFFSVMSNSSGVSFAHALMGHSDYLDTYYVLSNERKAQLYRNAEPELTIVDHAEIERKLEENKDLQQKMKTIVYDALGEIFPLDPRVKSMILNAKQ